MPKLIQRNLMIVFVLIAFSGVATLAQTGTAFPNDLEQALTRAKAGVTGNQQWQAWYPDGFEWEFDGVPMLLVPTGCFMMGSDVAADEQPIHEQCIDTPFWIDTYEVGQTQLTDFGMGHLNEYDPLPGDELPADNITWIRANNFCRLRGATLPSEVQWEYAARGVDSLQYPWGQLYDPEHLNDSVSDGWDFYTYTAPIDEFSEGRSWVGAYQMSGNVWEWVSTAYRPYPYDASDGRELGGSNTRILRVMRGGSWSSDGVDARSANRSSQHPTTSSDTFGFRCALTYEQADGYFAEIYLPAD